MYELEITKQFKKDYKLAKKRGFPTELLWDVIDKLVAQKRLRKSTTTMHSLETISAFGSAM